LINKKVLFLAFAFTIFVSLVSPALADVTYMLVGSWEVPGVGRIAVDSAGSIYVTGNAIWKYLSSGGLDSTWGTNGAADGQLKAVIDIGIDTNKNVYVAQTEGWMNGAIIKFNSTGSQLGNWGSILYNGPTALHVQSSGKVYAVFTLGSNPIMLYTFDTNGAVTAKKTMQGWPWSHGFLAVDSAGNFYLDDCAGNITKRNADGQTILATYNYGMMNSMNERAAVDLSGNVYVLKSMGIDDHIQIFKSGGTKIGKIKMPTTKQPSNFIDIAIKSDGSELYELGAGQTSGQSIIYKYVRNINYPTNQYYNAIPKKPITKINPIIIH